LSYLPNPAVLQDDLDLWNIIQVQRTGGILQMAQDATSISTYGQRVLAGLTGLLQSNDSDALYLAQWLLVRFQNPIPRVTSVTLSSTLLQGAAIPTMLGSWLWYLFNMNRSNAPGAPTAYNANAVVEYYTHTFTPGEWKTTWVLSPFEAVNLNNWFVLGTSALGGSALLAY
jgi:hypothetical protein